MRSDLLLFLWLGLVQTLSFGQEPSLAYTKIEKKYANASENDESVMPLVRQSIEISKKKKDVLHLMLACEDAVYYSKNRRTKLKYADSALLAARLSQNSENIGKAYLGRGIVHYFNFRNYNAALTDYLLAYQWLTTSPDLYLKNKVKYHIAIVKSHLGLYDEALPLFSQCARFFDQHRKGSDPNATFNNTRGYLNALHQMTCIYRNKQNLSKVDSLLSTIAPVISENATDYGQEKGYFLKEAGILKYHQRDFKKAADLLLSAENILKAKRDVAMLIDLYYYLGKTYKKLYNNKSDKFFLKADALYNQYGMITSEMRSTYEELLEKPNNNKDEIQKYVNRLVEIDSILNKQFPVLSSVLHRKYDTEALRLEKQKLSIAAVQRKKMIQYGGVAGLGIALLLVGFIFRERKLNKTYRKIMAQTASEKLQTRLRPDQTVGEQAARKHEYSPEIVDNILALLSAFESKNAFLDKNLTLKKMADNLKTNRSHLSYVINDRLNMNFNTYIKILRIKYITNRMLNENKVLNYTLEALAAECGIMSRQVFSKQFFEVNGIRPADFIRKRKEEIKRI